MARGRRTLPFIAALAALAALGAISLAPRPRALADIQPLSRVFLNGVPTPVYFNDGDSFRPKDGPYYGMQSRLGGFNTLESFGPVHQWGTWDPWELYVVAKEATLNARRGTWHCRTDGARDGYGRVLWDCPDLAVSHIRAGLAHAYTVDEQPSRFEYIRAQRDAIAAHRGMWAHGVPEFVMTSVHSNDEGGTGTGASYNRLVSVADGHSEQWEHHDVYGECQRVCAVDVVADPARVDAVAVAMHAEPSLAPITGQLDSVHLAEIASMYARIGRVPTWIDAAQKPTLEAWLHTVQQRGDFGALERRPGACMIYVAFQRRYGEQRAACLRH